MTQPQQPDHSRQQIQYELERQELLKECHSLVSAIGRKPYAAKLLKAAKNGLMLYLDYKNNGR